MSNKRYEIEDVQEAIASRFKIHPGFFGETENSFSMYGNCGCHERLMDQNCEVRAWNREPFNPEFTQLLADMGFYAEIENGEAVSVIRING